MESVVQVVRGSQLNIDTHFCIFCGSPATSIFSITQEKKYDGILLKCFPICKEHQDRINALLSGEFDIDEIFLDKYRTKHAKKVQLRQ
jgi:hypothetical protein